MKIVDGVSIVEKREAKLGSVFFFQDCTMVTTTTTFMKFKY